MTEVIVLHPVPTEPSFAGAWRKNQQDWIAWANAIPGFESQPREQKRLPVGCEVWVVGPPVKDPLLEMLARSAKEKGHLVRDLRHLGFVPPRPSGGGYGLEGSGSNLWHPDTIGRMLAREWVG